MANRSQENPPEKHMPPTKHAKNTYNLSSFCPEAAWVKAKLAFIGVTLDNVRNRAIYTRNGVGDLPCIPFFDSPAIISRGSLLNALVDTGKFGCPLEMFMAMTFLRGRGRFFAGNLS